MKIIVIGAGEIGKTLINMLSNEKHDVTLIEKEDMLVKDIANQTDILVIKGDATQMNILKDAGVEKADALVAVTNDDKTNLMVSEIAASTNIKKVIARVNTPGNEELFTKIGVTNIIPSVGLVVGEIKNALMRENAGSTGKRLIAELGNGDIELIEVTVGKDSPLVGKDTLLTKGVIAAIYRNGELIIPVGKQQEVHAGDVLVVSVKSTDSEEITKLINSQS